MLVLGLEFTRVGITAKLWQRVHGVIRIHAVLVIENGILGMNMGMVVDIRAR